MVKKGIPKEVLEEIDINHKEKPKEQEVRLRVEPHQAKIPIPRRFAISLGLKKGSKCMMSFDKETKKIICKFK